MTLLKPVLVICCFATAITSIYAQPSLSKMKAVIETDRKLLRQDIEMKVTGIAQAGILFKTGLQLEQNSVIPWLTQKLALRLNEDELRDDNKDELVPGGITVKKIRQFYKGIKVEHGVINSTSLSGNVAMMQMEFYAIPVNFNTTPLLTKETALQKAMESTGANVYAWQGNDNTNADNQKPEGELVIIQTYKTEGEVCLAYKFNIYAKQPLSRNHVYINAWDGTLVLIDPIIKHLHNKNTASFKQNEFPIQPEMLPPPPPINLKDTIQNRVGNADTRYNGRKVMTADSFATTTFKPYRLRQVRNNQKIITLDYQRQPSNTVADFESASIDFVDDNNDWTTAEFGNANLDNVALDVHHSMQYISDYWRNRHSRNGWDNNNGPLISYVHAAENIYSSNGTYLGYQRWYDNAYWNGDNMHFGDGNGSNHTPLTTLDVSAHEMGHAITEKTSALVYRWESGALNEGFSDIWSACVTNYATTNDPSITGELPWRIGEKCWTGNTPPKPDGLRDMQDPRIYNDPSTYNDLANSWKPATYKTCPVLTSNNDECGVHTNSGVLNKWFYLITQGESGSNTKGIPYSVTGIGFAKSEKIAYLMELNLTPNATFATAKNVSIYATANLYGYQSAELQTVKDAWLAVGVDTSIFNMENTPVFTTNNFISIAVGKDGYVWAGTSYSGLYRYNGNSWEKLTELPNVKINDIKADKNGGIWIAQSGTSGQTGGGSSIAGGVNYYTTSTSNTSSFYTVDAQQRVPSRNARCIFIDTTRLNDGTNPKVWMASTAYITSGNSTSGMLGQGLYNTYKEFRPISEGLNIASGTAGCLTVGGNASSIWTFAQANYGLNQLLVYNAGTHVLTGIYDQTNTPELPTGFVARAIYGDSKKRIWVGLANGGVRVKDEYNVWHTINSTSLFPTGTSVNFNAITGDKYGDVYIGTNSGLIYFDAGIGQRTRLDSVEYFRRYGLPNGLPSNNINAIAYDTSRFRVMMATDSGIVFWEPLCLGNSCYLNRTSVNSYSESKGNGNWGDAAIWSTGMLPDSTTNVVIRDTVVINVNAFCNSLYIANPGSVKINPGLNLKFYTTSKPIQTNSEAVLQRNRNTVLTKKKTN